MYAQYEAVNLNDIGIWLAIYENIKNVSHWHKEIELIFAVKGCANIIVNWKPYRLEEGGMMLCESGCVHKISVENESDVMAFLLFDANILHDFPFLPKTFLLPPEEVDAYQIGIARLFLSIQREIAEKKEYYKNAVISDLLCFMVHLLRNIPYKEPPSLSENRKDKVAAYQNLINTVERHFDTVTFQEACGIMHFSPAYFSKDFKKIFGIPFSEYLNHIRIEQAVKLLEENRKVTEVSVLCGFREIRTFNRVFKAVTGYTPTSLPPNFRCYNTILKIKSAAEFNPNISATQIF